MDKKMFAKVFVVLVMVAVISAGITFYVVEQSSSDQPFDEYRTITVGGNAIEVGIKKQTLDTIEEYRAWCLDDYEQLLKMEVENDLAHHRWTNKEYVELADVRVLVYEGVEAPEDLKRYHLAGIEVLKIMRQYAASLPPNQFIRLSSFQDADGWEDEWEKLKSLYTEMSSSLSSQQESFLTGACFNAESLDLDL